MDISRRSFLAALPCAAAFPAGGKAGVFFISDLHMSSGTDDGGTSRSGLSEFVSDVAESTSSALVVDFGDISFDIGEKADYELVRRLCAPLEKRGDRIVHALGNHDRRGTFFEVFPEAFSASPVPGRALSVVDLGSLDLIVMDTLDEGKVSGSIDDAQFDWLMDELPRRKRPFLLGAHHPAAAVVTRGSRTMQTLLDASDRLVGYIHGHDHCWNSGFLGSSRTVDGMLPQQCLPSAGSWGDVGYAAVSVSGNVLDMRLRQRAFRGHPGMIKKGVTSFPNWRLRAEDNQGLRRRIAF